MMMSHAGLYMCGYFAYTHTYVLAHVLQVLKEAREEYLSLGSLVRISFWVIMWVVGAKLGSFGREASDFNRGMASSPALITLINIFIYILGTRLVAYAKC